MYLGNCINKIVLGGCGKTEVRQPISHDRSRRISGLRCEMGVRPRFFRNLLEPCDSINDPMLAPPPFRRTSATAVELREGGGCMSLFGGPFFLAGVFRAFPIEGIVPMGNFPPQIGARPLMVLMSLAFLVVGGVLVFGRRWLTLDTGAGRLTRRAGLLVPMQTGEHRPLS